MIVDEKGCFFKGKYYSHPTVEIKLKDGTKDIRPVEFRVSEYEGHKQYDQLEMCDRDTGDLYACGPLESQMWDHLRGWIPFEIYAQNDCGQYVEYIMDRCRSKNNFEEKYREWVEWRNQQVERLLNGRNYTKKD